jgi:hypothetical protein
MDLTVTEPKSASSKVKQVYEIKDDTLWIATGNEAPPPDLKPGKGRRVTLYERQYTVEQVMQVLAFPVDDEHLKQLRNPMSFKEFLGILMESAEVKGKRLPILVDTRAFKADDPENPSIYDAQIKFTGAGQKSISSVLHAGLNMLPVGGPMLIRRGTVTEIVARGEPALIIQDGIVVITTRSAARKNPDR